MKQKIRDYSNSGLTIQQAMVDHVKRRAKQSQLTDTILWNGFRIKTSDVFQVPEKGIVTGEFLSAKPLIEQGFDIEIDNGWLRLMNGEQISHLRTWKDECYEDTVEYPFFSADRRLWVWNVYKMTYPGGQVIEEKWTENAGFWVEELAEFERIYHCSHGMAYPPDFESLVFKIAIHDRE